MSTSVRGALADLLAGALFQRIVQAAGVILLARTLGVERLGAYAFGLQLGALLALLADAGPRTIAAREAAADPERAWLWIRSSVRVRLTRASMLYVLYSTAVAATCRDPLFLLLCGLQAFLAVFDLKSLAEAIGRTRLEVLLEGASSVLYLGLIGLALFLDRTTLPLLAGCFLAGRGLYALLAAAHLPLFHPGAPRWRGLAGREQGLSLALLAHNLIRSCDILLLGWLAGPGPAGLFHAAQRLAVAAEVPLHVLGRLTRPHLNHAAAQGDCAATLERMIRASAFWILPVAAGGWLLAEPLLAGLFGADFARGGWTLRWLLLAGLLSGFGSTLGNALFARRRLGPYLSSLGVGMGLNLGLSLWFIPLWGSAGTALATVAALAVGTGLAGLFLRREVAFAPLAPLARPLLAALATLLAVVATPEVAGLPGRLAAGALAFGLALYFLELRGRWRGLGSGLEQASGFLGAGKEPRRAG